MNIDSIGRRLRKNSAFQKLAGRTCKPLNPEKWIFVVGCYNSGTSLLSSLISAHPECSGASNEGVALTSLLTRPEEFGWPRMWLKCEQEMMAAEALGDASNIADSIKRQWRPSFDTNSRFIVEKSITNALRIKFLSAHFKPACFVHITRDGIPVAEGIRRKSKPAVYANGEGLEKYPLDLCFDQWIAANKVIEESFAQLNSSALGLTIAYEDLCSNPNAVLSALFKDLSLDDKCLETCPLLVEKVSRVSNMNEKSYASLSSEEINSLKQRSKII